MSARTTGPTALAAFADTAAFSVLLAGAVTVPLTFSIDDLDVFARPKTILAVSLAAALVFLLVLRWLGSGRPRVDRRHGAVAAAVVLFVALNVVATWFAIDPDHSLTGEPLQYQGLAAFVAYAVFLLAAWTTLRTAGRRTALLVSVAIGATVVTAYAIVQGLRLDPIWDELPEGRVFSTIGQANALAAYLALTLPLIVCLGQGRRMAIQLMIAGLAMAILFAIALTLSRGALLAIGISALVFGVGIWPRRKLLIGPRALAIGGAALLAVVIGVLAVPDLRDRATAAIDRVIQPGRVEQASASAHLDQWAVGMAIALDHPLLGTGPDSYVLVFPEYRDDVIPPDRARVWARYRPESPHNVYLAIAGGAGVPALAAYLGMVVLVGLRLIRVVGTERPGTALVGAAVLAAISANLVTDFFMTAETTESTLFWIVLGVGAGMGKITKITVSDRRVWGSLSAFPFGASFATPIPPTEPYQPGTIRNRETRRAR